MFEGYKVWIISDGRGETGNLNACRGVAYSISDNVETYDKLRIDEAGGVSAFLREPDMIGKRPDFIISYYKNTAPYAASIKSILQFTSSSPIVTVQIRDPEVRHDEFDIIAIPTSSDEQYEASNVLKIFGMPHNVNQKVMEQGYQLWKDEFSDFHDYKKIVVLLGGDDWDLGTNYPRPLTAEVARNFGFEVNKLAKERGARLLITNSFRTSNAAWKAFINEINDVPAFVHDVHLDKENTLKANPYKGLLYAADQIIVTADSMSMCSEVVSTGKPTYIALLNESFIRDDAKRHSRELINNGFAEVFGDKMVDWDSKARPQPYNPTLEVARVALEKYRHLTGLLSARSYTVEVS